MWSLAVGSSKAVGLAARAYRRDIHKPSFTMPLLTLLIEKLVNFFYCNLLTTGRTPTVKVSSAFPKYSCTVQSNCWTIPTDSHKQTYIVLGRSYVCIYVNSHATIFTSQMVSAPEPTSHYTEDSLQLAVCCML